MKKLTWKSGQGITHQMKRLRARNECMNKFQSSENGLNHKGVVRRTSYSIEVVNYAKQARLSLRTLFQLRFEKDSGKSAVKVISATGKLMHISDGRRDSSSLTSLSSESKLDKFAREL
ncbi:7832_t:CDS:2 [Rhizophagus irregularis]|nr:7832_t:CDS:2 [Rhizophagus irregularis]